MKEIILPVGLVAVIGCMLLPLPSFAVDCLLVVNLIFSVLLVVSTLYLSEPVKLSSLPTILLLATLYRLALNISTTRRILGVGDAGEMIEMFGSLLMQGEMFVGLVVFLVLTLVQFIVIAKGSERVAEVSARFTLDALPGKQMSIDADVRSGLLGVEEAKKKRDELQIESRFYGALDGAMKFVKGDAIAGIIITGVNILGGLAVGLAVKGMSLDVALQKYTLLTLGDGLLSQVPALLNSLAAGLVVTRVASSESSSLANEVLDQLVSIRPALLLSGFVALLLAFVGVATVPFLLIGGTFFFLGFLSPPGGAESDLSEEKIFNPKIPSLVKIELPVGSNIRSEPPAAIQKAFAEVLQKFYDGDGLLFTPPELVLSEELTDAFQLSFRGLPSEQRHLWSDAALEAPEQALKEVCSAYEALLDSYRVECIDDIFTRRLLDNLEEQAPELVTNTIPGVISLTQLTRILRVLVADGISIRNIDLILQAVAENAVRAGEENFLLEEVRIALKHTISAQVSTTPEGGEGATVAVIRIDPMLDMWLAECSQNQSALTPEFLLKLERDFSSVEEENVTPIVITSRGSRALLQRCLQMRGVALRVVAEEELLPRVTQLQKGYVKLSEEEATTLYGKLAA
ncbi:flagellar biosynthesis protein FlhA [bacterium]|nr:flagellar biosynthesis protein FlhA [bacterium]